MEPLEQLDELFELDSDQECDLRPIDSDDSDDEFSQDLVERLRRFDSQRPGSRRTKRTKPPAEDAFERAVNAELTAAMAAHCRRLAPSLVSDRAAPDPRGGGEDGDTATRPQAVPAAPASPALTARPPVNGTAAATANGAAQVAGGQKGGQKEQKKKPEQQYYDDVYFDSDDDSEPEDAAEAGTGKPAESAPTDGAGTPTGGGGPPAPDPASRRSERRSRRRRPVLTDDQLLYDPEQDDRDQQWVDRQRRRYQPAGEKSGPGNLKSQPGKLPHSDAVLNCPACMTMLCLDCQRHELYSNQYRAMFVFNCEVDSTQALRYRLKEPSRRRGKRGGRSAGEADGRQSPPATAQELFNPVKCATCKTEVAVYDSDEVYHFFNVIASHS